MRQLLATAMRGPTVRRLCAAAAPSTNVHISLARVAVDRHSSALRHLVKSGAPVRGVASVVTALTGDHLGPSAAQRAADLSSVKVLHVGAGTSQDALRRLFSDAESLETCRLRELSVPSHPNAPRNAFLAMKVAPGADALALAEFARAELGISHFVACLAGEDAPPPSELLRGLGVEDADFSSLFLAEHVPVAA
tara:strand:+ start:955 stop:1536 length:582 start_codon:yes stop_codon:yes gene_type:complete